MVDGQFEQDKKLVDLKFRGSTNQKKIDVKLSLESGKTIELKFGDEERYLGKELNKDKNKSSKVFLYQEFKDKKEIREKEDYSVQIINNRTNGEDYDNVIPLVPGYEIQEIEEKISADNFDSEINNKL